MVDTISSDAEIAILSILVAYAFGLIGSMGTMNAAEFYKNKLKKPYWSPSPWVFGIVWLILYTLLGLSYWLVRRGEFMDDIIAPTIVYYILLIFLALWSWIFFAWKWFIFANVWLIVIFGLEIAVVVLFAQFQDWVPAVLNIPLLLWTFFAIILNSWVVYYNSKYMKKYVIVEDNRPNMKSNVYYNKGSSNASYKMNSTGGYTGNMV